MDDYPDDIYVGYRVRGECCTQDIWTFLPPDNDLDDCRAAYTRKDKADAEIERLTKERDEWKNKYLMKISEPVGK